MSSTVSTLIFRVALTLSVLIGGTFGGNVFAQDRPVRIIVESVKVTQQRSSGFSISRYGATRDDYLTIREKVPGIQWVAPIRTAREPVRYGASTVDVDLTGTTDSYARMLDADRIQGRFLLEKDVTRLNNVAVIGEQVSRTLFGDSDPLARNIRIDSDYYLVVGVVAPTALRDEYASPLYDNLNGMIFIPISTMRARFGDDVIYREADGGFSAASYQLSRIELVLDGPARLVESSRLISKILRKNHAELDYRIRLQR